MFLSSLNFDTNGYKIPLFKGSSRLTVCDVPCVGNNVFLTNNNIDLQIEVVFIITIISINLFVVLLILIIVVS